MKLQFTSYNKEVYLYNFGFYGFVIIFSVVKQVTSNIKASRNIFCDTCYLSCTSK